MTLLAEYERVAVDLLAVIRHINATNASAVLDPGVSGGRHRHARHAAQTAAGVCRTWPTPPWGKQERDYQQTEVRYQRVVDVATLRKQATKSLREARELDTRPQGANWTIPAGVSEVL